MALTYSDAVKVMAHLGPSVTMAPDSGDMLIISLSPVEVFQQVLFLERLQLDEVRRRGRRAIGDIHG